MLWWRVTVSHSVRNHLEWGSFSAWQGDPGLTLGLAGLRFPFLLFSFFSLISAASMAGGHVHCDGSNRPNDLSFSGSHDLIIS